MSIAEDGTTIRGQDPSEIETPRQLTIREALSELLQLRETTLDLIPVLERFNPDHVHWKEERDESGNIIFDPSPELYRWLKRTGLPQFVTMKLLAGRTIPIYEASRKLYEGFFRHHGIEGEILPYQDSEALLDYHTGARINPHPNGPLWPARKATGLFPEIDFRIRLDAPKSPKDLRQQVAANVYILVNTTKVGEKNFKPHLLGYWGKVDEWVPITNGEGFLRRVDEWSREIGITGGTQDIFVLPQDQALITTLLQARI